MAAVQFTIWIVTPARNSKLGGRPNMRRKVVLKCDALANPASTAAVVRSLCAAIAVATASMFAPVSLVAPFGMTLGGGNGRAEVRAVYGGFGVAVALMLILAVLDTAELRHGIVVAMAAALLGMAFGRLIARLFDRASGFYPSWFYFCVEAIGGGLLLFTALA